MVYLIKYYHPKRGRQFKTKIRASIVPPIDKKPTGGLENWNTYVLRIRNAQLPSLASVYEPYVIHSVTCECCKKAPKGVDTCPVKNQQLIQHAPGRPSIYRRDG